MRDIHISSSNHPASLPSWATAFPAGRFRSVSAQFDQALTMDADAFKAMPRRRIQTLSVAPAEQL
jgi:hypothetical protein